MKVESNTVLGSLSSGYHEMLCERHLTEEEPEFSGGFTSHFITIPLQWPLLHPLLFWGWLTYMKKEVTLELKGDLGPNSFTYLYNSGDPCYQSGLHLPKL